MTGRSRHRSDDWPRKAVFISRRRGGARGWWLCGYARIWCAWGRGGPWGCTDRPLPPRTATMVVSSKGRQHGSGRRFDGRHVFLPAPDVIPGIRPFLVLSCHALNSPCTAIPRLI